MEFKREKINTIPKLGFIIFGGKYIYIIIYEVILVLDTVRNKQETKSQVLFFE